jgi:hypothetical protein
LEHMGFAFYVLATAFVFAKLEIAIEGSEGWAAKLPTWRVQNRWTKLFFSSRPLTGYHFWMHAFIVLMVHLPFGLKLIAWSWPLELRIAAFVTLFLIVEDFLWFVLNPAYGLRKFTRQHVWWHAPTWWWIMPRDYWVFAPLGVLAYAVSHHFGGGA